MTPSRLSESIRQQVRIRADYRCEYCGKPETANVFGHHVDHIIPPMHGGTSEIDNLAWACFQCNVAKGTNVASYNEHGALTPLYHPRRDEWPAHFRLEEATGCITALTHIGQVTVNILQINHPDLCETRVSLIRGGLW